MAKPKPPEITPVHTALIVTLDAVPNYPTLRAIGPVAAVGTGSGGAAKGKGVAAYREALATLAEVAAELGANAVVGLTATTFGASQGGMLGDAVGVMLMGTGIVVKTADDN